MNKKNAMILDLSSVNVNKAGTYQYTVRFNNSIYTGNITITEDQPTLSTNIDSNNNNQQPQTGTEQPIEEQPQQPTTDPNQNQQN